MNNYFYHVVTERPMFVGQIIEFNEYNKNGVYHRSMNFEFKNSQGKTALEILREHTINNQLILNEEDTKVLTQYIEWSTKGYRELVLEMERLNQKIDVPSRMACLYVSRNIEDAYKWANNFKNYGREVFQIVKLKVNGQSFDGNAYHIKTETVSIAKQIEYAKNYWNNVPNEDVLIETIVDGIIEVIEIIEDFQL